MRTPRLLNDLFARIAEVGHSLVGKDDEETLGDLCAALLGGRGEATGLALAAKIFARYDALTADGKREFFVEAAHRFGVDESALTAALAAWHDDGDGRALHFASEPRSQELIRRLNRVPGGTRALVAMRADLLAAATDDAGLAQLDADFRHLLASWFNRGFLELRRIDWSSPAEVLEKIIAFEAVHAIDGWDDLRLRVAAPDRRLYAFFHPALLDEPLIFVEVALTDTVPAAVATILAGERAPLEPAAATVAVFYSINNCHAGLRGVTFGSFLIKQVVEELQGEFKDIKTFATLSPAPGLRRWASAECARGDASVLSAAQRSAVLSLDTDDDTAADNLLREVTARYLCDAKAGGEPLDRVARFHLGNGARLEAIHTAADPSERGVKNSFGVMVNYVYDIKSIERNHEAFANHGEVICAAGIKKLLKA